MSIIEFVDLKIEADVDVETEKNTKPKKDN